MSQIPCSFAASLSMRTLSLSVLLTSNESFDSGVHPIRSAYFRNMLVAYGELKISCRIRFQGISARPRAVDFGKWGW